MSTALYNRCLTVLFSRLYFYPQQHRVLPTSQSKMKQNLDNLSKTSETGRKRPTKPASVASEPDTQLNANTDAPIEVAADSDEDAELYDSLDWKRVPHLQRRPYEHSRGTKKSLIYQYGYPVWHFKKQQKIWLCSYCHQHKIPGGEYVVHSSTSSAASHLAQKLPGHGFDSNGRINFSRPPNQTSIVAVLQNKGVEVSQEVANELAASFSARKFKQAVQDWVISDNQSLRIVESSAFRRLIAAANPLAEQVLWKSHRSLRDHILREYYSYIPAVAEHLKKVRVAHPCEL